MNRPSIKFRTSRARFIAHVLECHFTVGSPVSIDFDDYVMTREEILAGKFLRRRRTHEVFVLSSELDDIETFNESCVEGNIVRMFPEICTIVVKDCDGFVTEICLLNYPRIVIENLRTGEVFGDYRQLRDYFKEEPDNYNDDENF